MQHVNDNMNELFRKAGEEYPLDISSVNWNGVLKKMDAAQPEKPATKKSTKKLLWLLLLLPIGFICNQFVGTEKTKEPILTQLKQSSHTPAFTEHRTNNASENMITKNESYTSDQIKADPTKINQTIQHPHTQHTDNKAVLHNRYSNENNVTAPYNKYNAVDIVTKEDYQAQRDYISFDQNMHLLSIHFNKGAQHQNIANPIKPKKQSGKENKGFYAGILGGADFTSVKFQKVEQAGYILGAVLGYQLNKKWSIESGLYYDKKFYYSKGEYFNTSKIYVPANTEIISVDGNCAMWEIPLRVRYTFKSGQKHNWFGSVGVSSYIMTKENYNYLYYYYATGQSHAYDKSYNTTSTYFSAATHVSAGYTHTIGKIAEFRIEPFLKIPLRGVGTGSLSLQSAGIQAGITRKF